MLREFACDRKGNVSLIFAGSIIPLSMMIGLAVDTGRAIDAKTRLQSAADSAAIAAANYPVSPNDPENTRQLLAERMVAVNFDTAKIATLTTTHVTVVDSTVSVSADADLHMSLMSLVKDQITLHASAKAKTFGKGAPLCLVALNRTIPEALKVWGTADVISPKCAIHSNSSSTTGMVTGGAATAVASQFCSAGGHGGNGFSPTPQHNCSPMADPYADKYSWSALSSRGISIAGTCHLNNFKAKGGEVLDAGATGGVMRICNQMSVGSGKTVTFKPGLYAFWGPVDFQAGANIVASSGVTFYIAGQSSAGTPAQLTVQAKANLNLVAPTSGPLAGMAFIDATGVSTNVHTIIGGGVVNIVGNMYAPAAKVRITGNGDINSGSSYFGIVADRVEVEGNGVLRINADSDSVTSGMPVMPSPSGGAGGGTVSLIE